MLNRTMKSTPRSHKQITGEISYDSLERIFSGIKKDVWCLTDPYNQKRNFESVRHNFYLNIVVVTL